MCLYDALDASIFISTIYYSTNSRQSLPPTIIRVLAVIRVVRVVTEDVRGESVRCARSQVNLAQRHTVHPKSITSEYAS